METISGSNVNLKKQNKENTKPTSGSTKSLIKRGNPKTASTGSVPQQSKIKKETILGQEEAGNGQKSAAASNATKKRTTLSQAFLTKQAVRQRQLVAEAPKPPATAPPKPVPGTYKGRVVQSKIGGLWKSSSTSLEGGVDNKAPTKASARHSCVGAESQKNGNLTKVRSRSIADLPRRGTQKPLQHQPSRSKSVADGPLPVSKLPAANRTVPSHSARAASAGTLARPNPSASAVISNSKESKSSKPKMPVATEKKVRKPPVSSTLSQYRAPMETAEERRAKLAEWLASKGKTLKRPPISSAPPPKTRSIKEPDVPPTSQSVTELESHVEPQPAAQSDSESQPGLQAPPGPIPASQPQEQHNLGYEEEPACGSSPLIMNTTLDLLENSSMDLPVDPEVRPGMDDIIVNLCDALEAMETSSACVDEPLEVGEFDEKLVDGKPDDIKSENVEVKREAGERTLKKDMSYVEEVESDDDDQMQTPEAEGASVVKYSVKTTPYLQRVRKTMEGEAGVTGSKRKSTIKDLKFLTPVRRSCRIQRNSSCLPGMLTDHDPCVSSLAELVQLDDDDANAYIYRKNPALLGDLPDHPRDLERI